MVARNCRGSRTTPATIGSAKEVSVEILESQGVGVPCEYCSHLEHANYLGRELQKAEFCLTTGATYVQD